MWGAWSQEGRLSRNCGKVQGSNAVPLGRGGPQGGAPRHNQFYALYGRQGVGEVLDVVTGMLKIFDFNVYALIDPGATISFVNPLLLKSSMLTPNCCMFHMKCLLLLVFLLLLGKLIEVDLFA